VKAREGVTGTNQILLGAHMSKRATSGRSRRTKQAPTSSKIDKVAPAVGDFRNRSTPRQINLELIAFYDNSWGDPLPESNWRAIGRCLIIIAQLETHDPLILRRATGYPLPFLSSLVWLLLKNGKWTGWGGYWEVINCIEEFPLFQSSFVDNVLMLVEELYNDPHRKIVDPFEEYVRCILPIDYQRPVLNDFSMEQRRV
jgi:hypothetical protein